MHLGHIKGFDLNLLVSLQALVEERSITRAGRRLSLTQPAMSRVFDRLQKLFGDELLIRTGGRYEPTHRALDIYAELKGLLPKISGLVDGKEFNPADITGSFRMEATDYAALVVLPGLTKVLLQTAPGLRIEVSPLDNSEFLKRLEANTLDLAFRANEAPQPFRSEPVFRDKCVCLIRKGHPLGGRHLTMEGYLRWKHVGGGGMGVVQQILDRIGCKRDVQLRVPFSVLGSIVERTDLIATVPQRMAKRLAASSKTQIVSAPRELQGFTYLQIWHPRYESDSVHKWLRELIKQVAV